jgi:putative transcriptional regulator
MRLKALDPPPADLSLDDDVAPHDAVSARAVVQRVRWHTGLTQDEFASTYRIGLERLRELEQGAIRPDSALIAYLNTIDQAPQVIRAALR